MLHLSGQAWGPFFRAPNFYRTRAPSRIDSFLFSFPCYFLETMMAPPFLNANRRDLPSAPRYFRLAFPLPPFACASPSFPTCFCFVYDLGPPLEKNCNVSRNESPAEPDVLWAHITFIPTRFTSYSALCTLGGLHSAARVRPNSWTRTPPFLNDRRTMTFCPYVV